MHTDLANGFDVRTAGQVFTSSKNQRNPNRIPLNPHVTATVYAHALPGRDDLAADVWEKFQNAGRVKEAIGARPSKPAGKKRKAS